MLQSKFSPESLVHPSEVPDKRIFACKQTKWKKMIEQDIASILHGSELQKSDENSNKKTEIFSTTYT